ncbi:MAG: hypothetical protein IAE77_15830 [Prosthecobacter sp.]|jgi:hypothetical protein|uniref:hypothetical protein n=1 Tax=Prosthecobacter sp. TaxID=1965333 RepID=UPI001A018124|nr:hypothetical protein [Prosthecobacter sp.]MBE2284930.1 hypothetical protein [Prosthecobacter sp.]
MNRTAFITLAVLAVAAIGYRMAAPDRNEWLPVARQAGTLPAAPPTATKTDPTEVFQRAFWKRPVAEDHILHAERREWADSKGVQHWQWFIAVQPSPALVKHLRDDNAFNLVVGVPSKPVEHAPDWFITRTITNQMHSPMGKMCLLFDDTTNTLYATDSGGGFSAGAPQPGKAIPQTAAAGRLPTSPPPKP